MPSAGLRLRRVGAAVCVATFVIVACSVPDRIGQPIFVDGRAVEPVADSLLAMTRSGSGGVFVRDRRSGMIDTIGADHLTSALHVQEAAGKWYVSDAENGRSSIVVLSGEGTLELRIPTDGLTTTPHQFAVLAEGRIVLESRDGGLIALSGDSVSTFALTERGQQPALLVAARGGVLHALPGHYITLYNRLGNIVWRIDWPWLETAVVTDLAVDAVGRYHVFTAFPTEESFRVYTLSEINGEVIRWSGPSVNATFVVRRLGEVVADEAKRWLGR